MSITTGYVGKLAYKTSNGVVVLLPATTADNVIGLDEYIEDAMAVDERTAAQFTTADPVLPNGKIGKESDTGAAKLGDGVSSWTELDYINRAPGSDFMEINFDNTMAVIYTQEGTQVTTIGGQGLRSCGVSMDRYDTSTGTWVEIE